MSNRASGSMTEAGATDETEMAEIRKDPVLRGDSALTDPNLGGSTAASWTGTGGPDPGGMVGPAGTGAQQGASDTAEAGDQLQQAVSQAGDQMQQAVGQAVDQAQQTAGQVVEGVRAQATSRLSAGKDQLAGTVGAVAQALRQSTQGLRDQNQTAIAQYAEQGADRLEGTATYLRERDVQELLNEVEDVARRQPMLFLGAAFGLGFLAARFIKSSRQQATEATARAGQGWATTPAASAWQRENTGTEMTQGESAIASAPVGQTTPAMPSEGGRGQAAYRLEASLPGSADLDTSLEESGSNMPRV